MTLLCTYGIVGRISRYSEDLGRKGGFTIILISGDRDFVEPISKLRSCGHEVLLIAPDNWTSRQLAALASKTFPWSSVLGGTMEIRRCEERRPEES